MTKAKKPQPMPYAEPYYTDFQLEAYKDACIEQAKGWVSVGDRLPDEGVLVMVYSPPGLDDHQDSVRIDFDFIEPDSDGECWHYHNEHYEHYCAVSKGDSDHPMIGPSEKAPYTHWMPFPEPPSK